MNKDVYDILNILNSNKFDAYIVGGFVRDYLLGMKSDDYDICTSARDNDLIRLFDIVDNNFGSLKIKYNNKIYEITTFRKDFDYINNRRPSKIEYVNTLEEDLLRRDFTINTICMDKDGNIIDLMDGIIDLNNKVIKCVGDVSNKLQEDALRILRAIRFATVLDFKLDDSLKDGIMKYGYLVKNLSYFRKRQELDKIFNSNNIEYGIKLLKEFEMDKYLEINLDIKITDLLGIWAQINNLNYPFTKEEMKIIDNYKKTSD